MRAMQPIASASAPPAPKPWWRSRTLWFNAVCAGLGAAELGLGLLKDLLPVNAHAVLAFVLVVGNTMLRAVTNTGLVVRPLPEGDADAQ